MSRKKRPYNGELKVGMKVKCYRNNCIVIDGEITSVTSTIHAKVNNYWNINRKTDGFWGGDCTSGHMEIEFSTLKQILES